MENNVKNPFNQNQENNNADSKSLTDLELNLAINKLEDGNTTREEKNRVLEQLAVRFPVLADPFWKF